jgi:hypothetical protein
MTDRLESMLNESFVGLERSAGEPDWSEVRRRARRLAARRLAARIGTASTIACLAVVLATPAFGLRGRLVHLFTSGEPAPARVVKGFATLDVGAPPGMATGVIAGETREVMAVPLSTGYSAVLWVAPTHSGGFCEWLSTNGRESTAGSGGCDRDRLGRFAPGLTIPGPVSGGGKILKPPVVIDGHALDDRAARVEIHFEDGAIASTPVVWVSAPINAGFFIYEVPQAHWDSGHRPSTFVLEDSSGHELAMLNDFPFGSPVDAMSRFDPQTGTPALAVAAERRQLIAFTSERGTREALWVAPRRGGGQCHWLTSDGHPGRFYGCPPPSAEPLPAKQLAMGLLGGGAPVLVEGQVGSEVASVELHYQDGAVDRLQPVEGFVLSEIGSQHWPPGHRLDQVIGLNATGRQLAEQPVDVRAVGTYPCDKPVHLGAGERGCP